MEQPNNLAKEERALYASKQVPAELETQCYSEPSDNVIRELLRLAREESEKLGYLTSTEVHDHVAQKFGWSLRE